MEKLKNPIPYALVIVEIPQEIFQELEEDGWVKVVLMRQRIGEGVRHFVQKVQLSKTEKKEEK